MNASKEEFKRRIEICKACPSSQVSFGVGLTCGRPAYLRTSKIPEDENTCGCVMSIKGRLKNASCPQQKW